MFSEHLGHFMLHIYSTSTFNESIVSTYALFWFRKMEEESKMREQMFQEYKESKDIEMLRLKQINHDLKIRLDALLKGETSKSS